MDHNKAKELLSEYLDGELCEENRLELENHLEFCVDCTKDFEQLKKTINVLSSISTLEAPEDFEKKVRERLKKRARRRDLETSENLSNKVPFETVCLIMLVILAAFYLMLYLLPQIEADKEFQQDTRQKEILKDAESADDNLGSIPGYEHPPP